MGSILYLKEVPPAGGDTLFASMYAAYDALSDSMQRFLSGLTANLRSAPATMKDACRLLGAASNFRAPSIRWCGLIRNRPKALFINRLFTTRLVQLKKHESDAILEMLFRHLGTPNFNVDFTGKPTR